MQSALDSAIGLPRSSTSASWMLALLMPLDVRRSFKVPPWSHVAGETGRGALRIRTWQRPAGHRNFIGSGRARLRAVGAAPCLTIEREPERGIEVERRALVQGSLP